MTIENALLERSESKCELCSSTSSLSAYDVQPNSGQSPENHVLLCEQCLSQINDPASMDEKHWYCLNNSMWSPIPAVQVLAYRVLKNLESYPWAQDLLTQLYLDEETQKWADAGLAGSDDTSDEPVLDSNGTVLNEGDSVTLIKDLVVKGANFTAKRGTTVKNIALTGDPKFIEGRINGTRVVLVAAYLKKA